MVAIMSNKNIRPHFQKIAFISNNTFDNLTFTKVIHMNLVITNDTRIKVINKSFPFKSNNEQLFQKLFKISFHTYSYEC